jgi:hypothetical protein
MEDEPNMAGIQLDLMDSALERCRKRDIRAAIEEGPFGPRLGLELPAGPSGRKLYFGNVERLEALLQIDFEKYVALGEYLAISSYGDGVIEALVESAGQGPPPRMMIGRAADQANPILSVSRDGVEVSLGDASPDLDVLMGRGRLPQGRGPLALRISGLNINRYDFALDRLEAISNGFFMELDSAFGLPLVLRRARRARAVRRGGSRNLEDVNFPISEYDPQPMALYWYGRGAMGMPLLRFLAFYQVLEFYFPIYAEQEARRRIKSVVKDPNFKPHKESHISKIMKALNTSGRRGFGDERAQLRATIRACANADDLRDYLSTSKPRAQHFDSAKSKKSTASRPIRIGMDDGDLLDATAERIYEIRCRIVHTKDGESDLGQLLPFSPEAEAMDYDIDLIEMLARSVLVAGSRELSV